MIEPRNDDRIDSMAAQVAVLAAKVDGLGGQVRDQREEMKAGFERFDGEMKAGFKRVDGEMREQRREMTAGFKRVDERFERMYRMMVSASALIIVALIGAPHL